MARTRQRFAIDHVETVRQEFARKTETHSSIVQLSPGGLAYSGNWVEFPGIRLEWNTLDSCIRAREVQDEWGVLFGFARSGSKALNFRGFPVVDNMGVLYRSGSRMDYVAGPGVRSLIVCVHRKHLEERQWTLDDGEFRQIAHQRLVALEAACRRITERDDWNEAIEQQETQALLDALGNVLEAWMGLDIPPLPPKQGAFHFEVVEDVERLWKETGSGRAPTVTELVEKIGIPERTLHHAFKASVGMGPIRYLKLLRLHNLRDCLLKADPEVSSVAELAHEQGFDQLGRMAGYYKRHFLESPSATLKRRSPSDESAT